ncbi:MAG: DUF4337 domain-containing protein [Verrucomicrobiota bacterium]|jgi:uncharacterized protein YoxC
MSHDGFHVHGPDQHAVEHQAQHGEQLAIRVSIMTAILATFGAVFSFLGASHQSEAANLKNDAILLKNEANQLRTQAANQWAFYQAKSTKQNLAELGASLTNSDATRSKLTGEIERYKTEKAEILKKAQALDADADSKDAEVGPLIEESRRLMHPHHMLAQAITFIQVGIALASICALTKVKALFWASATASAIGILLALSTLFPHSDTHPSGLPPRPDAVHVK